MGHKGPVLRPSCIGLGKAQTQTLFYSIPRRMDDDDDDDDDVDKEVPVDPMKAYSGAEVLFHSFLTSALGRGGQLHAPTAQPP